MSSQRPNRSTYSVSYVRKKKRKPLKILAAALALIIVGLVAAFYLVTSRPASSPEAIFTSSIERDYLARNLESRIQGFQKDVYAPTPQVAQPRMQVTEREVNAYIQSSPAIQAKLQSKGITQPEVKLNNDTLTVTADVDYHGVIAPVTITGLLVAKNGGTVSLQLQTFKIGRLGVPRIMTEEIASKIYRMSENGDLQLPHGITDIHVVDGKLIVTGTPPPQ